MRKGLVVTLGVVALAFVVSPGFAVAPIISCIPDVIISDVEQNALTIDNNFFVFSDALDLDEYVTDSDTTITTLRWSFIDPSGNIEINAIGSNTSGNVKEPGAFDIRVADQMASFVNVLWDGVGGGGTPSMDSLITMFASDGVDVSSQTVNVTTVDDDGPTTFTDGTPDGLVSQSQISYDFETGDDSWEWYTEGGMTAATNLVAAGSLQMSKTAAQSPAVYGTWESPKNPSIAVKARIGCVLRARYQMTGSVEGFGAPGFRMRAVWAHVLWVDPPGVWANDFSNQDFNVHTRIVVNTYDGFALVTPRTPGAAGQTYTLLFYPQETPTIMDDDAIVYLTCDLFDDDVYGTAAGNPDAGTLRIEQVDVDGFDLPSRNPAAKETALSVTDFSSWTPLVASIGSGTHAGVTVVPSASGVAITVTTADSTFDASAVDPGVQLVPGRYYRTVFTLASSATPGVSFGPLARCGFVSAKYAYSSDKELAGGGLYSAIGSTPVDFEVWTVGLGEDVVASGLTEPMQLRLVSWLTTNVHLGFGMPTAGTLTLSEVYSESYAESEIAP